MRLPKTKRSKKLLSHILFAFLIMILLALILLRCNEAGVVHFPENWLTELPHTAKKLFLSIKFTGGFDDDQRSTLWPLLVSLIIAMVGSLITTYVFLKSALDRTADEKPYFLAVIRKYREETVKKLWRYTVFSLVLITLVVVLYALFYFVEIRFSAVVRVLLIFAYLAGLAGAAYVLHKCIDIDRGLDTTAKNLLDEKIQHDLKDINICVLPIRSCMKRLGLISEDQIKWLQIEKREGDKKYIIDKTKLIARFSEWEKFTRMLTGPDGMPIDERSMRELITASVEKGMQIFSGTNGDIEDRDAKANRWDTDAYKNIQLCRRELAMSGASFGRAFALLSECRNLLLVLSDLEQTPKDGKQDNNNFIAGKDSELSDIFFYFLICLSVEVFRILPKITVFFPAGRFDAADFYGVRFEDSSFRSSSFTNAVFTRAKINNSNFSISKFTHCLFFNTDSRNCSFSNTLLEKCDFQEAVFDDVDFTGAELTDCDLRKASFQNSFLVNLVLKDTALGENEFLDSKIGNVFLTYGGETPPSFKNCNFTNSSLTEIRLYCKGLLDERDHTGDNWQIKELHSFLQDSELQAKFFPGPQEQETGIKALKEIADPFSFSSSIFADPKEGRFADESVIPIWAYIKEATPISWSECVFRRTVMPGFRFFKANLDQSVFDDAQINNAAFFCVYMPGCLMRGVNLREALLLAVVMKSVILDDAIFFKSTCKIVNFEDASLRHLHASEAFLQYCSFSRSDCSNIDFTRAQIRDSAFRDAILTGAELTESQFKNATLVNSVADQMLASYTMFEGCSFLNADLSQSNLNYAEFRNCAFGLADFSDCTVTGARFEECDFNNSNFRGSCFVQAVFVNCENLSVEIFEECMFIQCSFLERNEDFGKDLSGSRKVRVVE